ncbi:hemerythrin domain-containing protein [Nocardia brasiliensis]|uniref:hemerythrin domain-containing protein n=1 Tax=Nocardia brasiliensis TaxID=37326 RepID=UPI002454BCE0|nr:hemerythrin domain-containing protein [Nocardia brasiliensis]
MTDPMPAASPQRAVALGAHLRAVHAGLRRDLAAIRDRLADPEAAEISSLPNDLLSHCVAFCGELQQHHGNEDRVFPALARRHPELAPVVERLQREHAVVAAALAALRRLLAAPDRDRLAIEFDRIAMDLESHLRYEEETLVATLNVTDPATLRG